MASTPAKAATPHFDVAIIGGGINGTAIAAAAASAGLKTLLVESNDLGSGGSNHTQGLISGDLNLLDQLAFERVRQHLKEQQTAQKRAPHLVHPHHFFLLDQPLVRSSRRVKAGMGLYRRLQRQLPIARNGLAPVKLLHSPQQQSYGYVDCSFECSRYVIAQALLAREQGADIRNYTALMAATRCHDSKRWQLWVLPETETVEQAISADTLINASGTEVANLLQDTMQLTSRCQTKTVNSINLVIEGLDPAFKQHGFCFQASNKQLIQLLPTQLPDKPQDFPGDKAHQTVPFFLLSCSNPPQHLCGEQQQQWLLNCVNEQLAQSIHREQVVSRSHGQRNLCHEAWLRLQSGEVSTEPALVDFDCQDGYAPLVNIFNSHLSAHRLMAEQVLESLAPYFATPLSREQIELHARLPLGGGEFNHHDLTGFVERLQQNYPKLPPSWLKRIALQYGSHSRKLLGTRQTKAELGVKILPGLYEFEVEYLCRHHWAKHSDDILGRRCALAHLTSQQDRQKLDGYLRART